MSDSTRLGLGTLAAAVALGVMSEALLRATPWGANVGIWIACLLVAVLALARWHRIELGGDGRWLVLPVVFFAAAFACRDSAVLTLLNLLALLIALGLTAGLARAGQVRLAGLTDYALRLCLAAWREIEGLWPLLFGDIRWKELPTGGWGRYAAATGRGLFIAVPLAVVFGGLFASADLVFQGLVINLFRWDFGELVLRMAFITFWAWLAGGFLRQTLVGPDQPRPGGGCPRSLSLGIVEIGIVFGTLDVLFLTFVVVQLRYFFGGAALVEASTTLTYAEYARRGFFELVAVAALVLPILLVADWVLRRDRPGDDRLFRALAAALVAMLFVVMASAVQRMLLYTGEYGLTELRVYTTAFMGWLAVVFLWFLATVLRGQRQRFGFGALVTGFAAIALLNALNPDALIVRTNVSRPRFDAAYNGSLSADAVPGLLEALSSLPEAERGLVAERVLERWSRPTISDWRTWNQARSEARELVREQTATLQAMAASGR